MIVRKATREEYRRINELFAICFEMPYSNCPIDPEHDDAAHWAAFHESGEMMSNFTVSRFDVHFDGHSCSMGGIGGVATLPEFRRRGGIRACFEAALPDMYASGFDFSYLYPFSTAYYRKFGYECCVQKYHWTVDLGLLSPVKTEGSFRLAEKSRPMTDAIRAIDAVWESKYNMMVCHKPEHYDWTERFDPAVKQEFAYVCFDEAGIPKAYTTFKTAMESDGRNILCSRFCFVDKAGFSGLLELFKSLSADHRYVKFQTPAQPSLQYLLPEWSLGAAQWSVAASSGMVRVVNVKSVLEKARYQGSGSVTLSVRDGQIPENNGTFAVTFRDGMAVRVEAVLAEPDAVLTIPAFSALIVGVCNFADAAETFDGLEICRNTPALNQVFYRKPLMILDYF